MTTNNPLHHSPVEIRNLDGEPRWVLYASQSEPKRLIVFVHGFGFGDKAVTTWNWFPASGQCSDWWRASDMLFVAYRSLSERPRETAAWLGERLADFYPLLPANYLRKRDAMVRPWSGNSYDELFLVGHSLGGVILRLVLLEEARMWLSDDPRQEGMRPPLLDAQMRLFSPALEGFKPAGPLATLTCLLAVGKVVLTASPAFGDLQQGSELLVSTRDETERFVDTHGADLAALRAHILWARPEKVVEPRAYQNDYNDRRLIPERDHSKVCKPHDGYEEPRRFVETGRHR